MRPGYSGHCVLMLWCGTAHTALSIRAIKGQYRITLLQWNNGFSVSGAVDFWRTLYAEDRMREKGGAEPPQPKNIGRKGEDMVLRRGLFHHHL